MEINHIGEVPTEAEIGALVDEMKEHLKGKGMMLQGAALADLVAMFFAGHNPEIRDRCMEAWIVMMTKLIAENEKEILEAYGISWDMKIKLAHHLMHDGDLPPFLCAILPHAVARPFLPFHVVDDRGSLDDDVIPEHDASGEALRAGARIDRGEYLDHLFSRACIAKTTLQTSAAMP